MSAYSLSLERVTRLTTSTTRYAASKQRCLLVALRSTQHTKYSLEREREIYPKPSWRTFEKKASGDTTRTTTARE
jgi:hypothetical protein